MDETAVRSIEHSLCHLRVKEDGGVPGHSVQKRDMNSNSEPSSELEPDTDSDGEISMCVPRR